MALTGRQAVYRPAPSRSARFPTSSITQRPSSFTSWKKISLFSKLKKYAWTTARHDLWSSYYVKDGK